MNCYGESPFLSLPSRFVYSYMECAQLLSCPGRGQRPRATKGASGYHWRSLMLDIGLWFLSITGMRSCVGNTLETIECCTRVASLRRDGKEGSSDCCWTWAAASQGPSLALLVAVCHPRRHQGQLLVSTVPPLLCQLIVFWVSLSASEKT